MNPTVRIWLHRSRSLAWVVLGVLSFPLGWANAVWFVTLASIYANIESGWATSEAADDRTVVELLEEVINNQNQILDRLRALESQS